MKSFFAPLAMVVACAMSPASLAAQDEMAAQDTVIVEAGSAENASGRVSINLASGTNNQQAGAAAIAIGEIALASISLDQINDHAISGDRATAITIGERAFAGLQGLSSVNIAAGQNNQSANLAVLAIGSGAALSDIALSQARAPTQPREVLGPDPETRNDSIDISGDAFLGGTGLLQVNLVGGERNSSANTFVLSMTGSGN